MPAAFADDLDVEWPGHLREVGLGVSALRRQILDDDVRILGARGPATED
jgi:hypothetical protein